MLRHQSLFLLLASVIAPGTALAQLAPPAIRTVKPLGIAPGTPAALEVRATNLETIPSLRFDDPGVLVESVALAKPDGADAQGGRKLTARVVVPADRPAGPLRFRLVTPLGLSGPGRVWVGRRLPAFAEAEPNNRLRKAQAIPTGAAIEGTISPGDDVDLFAVDLKAGETLVAETIAERAGSGLDALLTVFGPDGRELASDDDRFGRDAAVSATAPVSGRYVVQLQDANGKNRDGMIEQRLSGNRDYRLEIGRVPLVTSVFPAGTRRGQRAPLRLLGANLPDGGLAWLEPGPEAPLGDWPLRISAANAVNVRVGDAPEVIEAEPNDELPSAQAVLVPAAINGTLGQGRGHGREPDVDHFRLRAAPGFEGDFRITAYAARIGSPADPVLTVLDSKGDAQGEDDDKLGRDARIERRVDAGEGTIVAIRDYFGRGGPAYHYRIEAEPIAGRGLTVTANLGGRTIPRRGGLVLPLTLERRGFDGPVTVLAGELPPGVAAAPVTLAPKSKDGNLILTATADAPLGPFPLRLIARDVPMSVEFAYRERAGTEAAKAPADAPVAPAEALLAIAEPCPLGLAIEPETIEIKPGGQAEVKLKIDRREGAAKKTVKVRWLIFEGDTEGLEPLPETSVPAGSSESILTLKAKPNAPACRRTLTARAWFDDGNESLAIAAPAAILNVSP